MDKSSKRPSQVGPRPSTASTKESAARSVSLQLPASSSKVSILLNSTAKSGGSDLVGGLQGKSRLGNPSPSPLHPPQKLPPPSSGGKNRGVLHSVYVGPPLSGQTKSLDSVSTQTTLPVAIRLPSSSAAPLPSFAPSWATKTSLEYLKEAFAYALTQENPLRTLWETYSEAFLDYAAEDGEISPLSENSVLSAPDEAPDSPPPSPVPTDPDPEDLESGKQGDTHNMDVGQEVPPLCFARPRSRLPAGQHRTMLEVHRQHCPISGLLGPPSGDLHVQHLDSKRPGGPVDLQSGGGVSRADSGSDVPSKSNAAGDEPAADSTSERKHG